MEMNKKIINDNEDGPMVSQIDSDLEEDNSYELQDRVLSCLFELELSAATAKKNIEMMEEGIKKLKNFIHGEDIN
jgi:hypothetical protein|tara:strand:- start:3035 stop:3259 length:225 start_codon:yes stop_codon:yes gene_type:complete